MRGIRTICTLLAVGIVCSFCACGEDADDKASETANITSSVTSETESVVSNIPDTSDIANSSNSSDTSESTDKESTDILPQEYTTLIEDHVSAFPWFDDGENLNIPHGGSDLYRYHDNLSEVGYALIDINSDGLPELILSGIGTNIKPNCVYDMFTIKDGEVIHVFSSGERFSHYLYNNGIIEKQWSSSAVESGHDFFRLQNGELKLIERVTYDAYYAEEIGLLNGIIGDEDDNDCYFKSNTEDFKDCIHITADEANKIIETYRKSEPLNITYTSLAEYDK